MRENEIISAETDTVEVYNNIPSTRINYVEPNYTTSYTTIGSHGVHSNEMLNNLEDYSTFVNLSVEVRGRTINVTESEDNHTYIINWESQQGKDKISFLQGSTIDGINKTSNVLTTDYTNVFFDDVQEKPSTELFGIESIDIEYNNMMVPQVTMKFVDVRGVALFSAEEMASFRSENGMEGYKRPDVTGSFFKSFFTMPYPIYKLVVKGYYGKPTTYTLTVQDFRASFQSNTGNFNVTVKFVGFQFSFLGDITLNSLMAAPYSDWIGADYWKAQVDAGRFVFDDGSKMLTLSELYGMIQKASVQASAVTDSSPEMEVKTELDINNDALNGVAAAYKAFSDTIKEALSGYSETKDFKFGDTNVTFSQKYIDESGGYLRAFAIMVPDADSKKTLREILGDNLINKIYQSAESLKSAINEYNGGNENNMIPVVDFNEIINLRPRKIFDYANGSTVITFDTGLLSSYPGLENWMGSNMTSVNSTQITDVKILDRIGYLSDNLKFDKKNSHGNLIEGFGLHSGIVFISSDFLKIFNSEKENNDIKIQENETEIAKVYQKAIIDTLGFVPSVGNITKLVMAHFETYVHMIRETAISIESSEPKRTMSSLGVGPDNLPDFKDGESAFVPPFPKVTEQRTNSDGSMINEESWIGNLNGNWLEKELVNGFINGVKIVNTQIEEAAETTPGDGTVINTNTPMEIPVSPMDMILSSSPYGNSVNFSDVSDVVGLIGLRMLQIFGATNSGVKIDDETLVSPIARAEARNFRKFFPNPSNEFLEKLGDENNKFADIAFDMLTNSKPEYVATYGKDNKYAWSNPRLSTVEGLVDSNFSLKTFGYSNGGRYLPVQGVGFEKINSDLNPTGNVYNKPSNGESYIATKCIDNTTNNNECANNLIKIDPFPQRYKMIIEERVKGDDNENIAAVKDALMNVFDLTKSGYGGWYNGNSFLFDLMQGTPTCKEKSNVFPETKRTKDEAEKTKAFDALIDKGYNLSIHEDYDGLEFAPKVNESFWTDLDTTKCSLHVIKGICSADVSLFGEQGYYNYTDYYHRAFLFLYALGNSEDGIPNANGFINYKTILSNFFSKDKVCLFVPYAAILMAGALYWLESNPLPTGNNFWKGIQTNPSNFGLKNIRKDVKNVLITEFKKWVDEKFKPVIAGGLEIDFVDKAKFFSSLKEMEDGGHDLAGQECVDNVEAFFIEHTSSDRFFKNYLTVDEDVVGPLKQGNSSKEYGVLLGMRDKTNAAKEVTRVAMQMYALVTPTKYTTTDSTTDVSMNSDKAKVFLSAFCDELKKQYGEPTEAANGDNSGNIDRTKETEMPEDIRVGVYRYLKLLYDKWIAGDTIKDKYSLEYFFEGVNGKAPVFIFIDSFYHKIGRDFLVNIDKIGQQIDSCRMNEQYTLLSFLSVMCQDNKFNFFCINNFLDLSIKENLEKMFTPIPYLEMGTPSSDPNFIIQYPYEPSSHLDLGPDSEYKDDSFMINGLNGNNVQVSPNFPVALTDSAEAGYSIPAFGVSYGKMYQSYFTDIDVNMDAPMSTEQTFKAIYQIASMNNESTDGAEKNMTAIGQDLYTIYSNNSYTCNVRMMGCAWVQPLMYFCLTNVPMFKGTYYIVKVTHHIERGNMVTNFTGVRMANNMTRKVQDWCVLKNPTSTGGYSSQDLESMKNKAANVDNDCPYPVYPLFNNGGVGGAIPTEDLMMKTRDVIQKYGIKAYSPIMDNGLYDLPLWETLAAMAYQEAGIEGELGMKIHAGFQCNYWHHNKSWLFTKNRVSWAYSFVANKDKLVDGKPSKDIVKSIYFNGPAQLIGQTTQVDNSHRVRKVFLDKQTEEYSSPVTLTYEMLSTALLYCVDCGYDHALIGKPGAGCPVTSKGYEREHSFWWKGKYLFHHRHSVYIASPDNNFQPVWKLEDVPVKNDNVNKKEKEFIKALGRAVHDTCANSAIQGNVGFDEKTLTENTIRFTCDDKIKLPGVFDVCLNTDYFNYIEELRWMIPNDNGAKGNPSYIYVKASEKPGTNKIVGVYKEDTKGVYNSSEVNEQYAKSITKYLNKGGNAKYITTPISDDTKKGIEIIDCNTLVVPSSDGLLYGGNYDAPYVPFDGNAQDRSNRNKKLITEYGFPQEALDLLNKFGSKTNQDRYKQLTKNLFVKFEYETRYGKQSITLHKKVAEAVKRAFEEIKRTTNFNVCSAGSGLQIRCVNNGNGRSNRASNHALGLAFDINAGSGGNPFFFKAPFKNKINQEPPVGTKASNWCAQKMNVAPYGGGYDPQKCIWHWGHPVVRILAKYGIGWGGDYGDTMHFSFLGGS